MSIVLSDSKVDKLRIKASEWKRLKNGGQNKCKMKVKSNRILSSTSASPTHPISFSFVNEIRIKLMIN